MTPDQLMTALTTRAIETMGERIVKNLDAEASSVSRDALAKNLYAKLFDWLVAAINRKISAIGTCSSTAVRQDAQLSLMYMFDALAGRLR